METRTEQLVTEIVYQGNQTYEIRKCIEGYKGDKAILIGLYPTVNGDNITRLDSTQFHLINHLKDLGLSEVRIMNLYPTVFYKKPSTSELIYDMENLEYITNAINSDNAENYKLIIAYGSSHNNNRTTNTIKKNLLDAIAVSKLKNKVYQISSEFIDTIGTDPTHVLYLGLRHGDEQWNLVPLDIRAEMGRISARLAEKESGGGETKKRTRKK